MAMCAKLILDFRNPLFDLCHLTDFFVQTGRSHA